MLYTDLLKQLHDYPAIEDDTRFITKGALYVAGGGQDKALHYAKEAIRRGARAIVGSAALLEGSDLSYIKAPEGVHYAAELARLYYRNPSEKLLLLGVTGTCGKTTTTYLLEAILTEAGYKVGVIGTENYRYANIIQASQNTTPGPLLLSKLLRTMLDAGCNAVIVEVSSHGIKHARTQGLLFDGAIFTNLSLEHQDFHPTMEDYFLTKSRLFTEYADLAIKSGKKFHACVNVRDPYGLRLADIIASLMGDQYAQLKFSRDQAELRLSVEGIRGEALGVSINSSLLGNFNAENILGAVGMAKLLHLPADKIASGITKLTAVNGRMEKIVKHHKQIIVDFAHKPEALEQVLLTLKPLCKGKLVVVFGCGGNRDKTKRPVMGHIAVQHADRVYLTSDNQRLEPIDAILNDILSGITSDYLHKVSVIPDRKQAIAAALAALGPDDVVLVAGRGSEPELSLFDPATGTSTQIPFRDRDVILALLIAPAQ